MRVFTVPTLPVELLDLIADTFCATESVATGLSTREISSYSFVSHSFSERIRRHLFRSLEFSSLQRVRSFHDLCSGAPDLPSFARDILITSRSMSARWNPTQDGLLASMIEGMTNLRTFGMQRVDCQDADPLFLVLQTLPLNRLQFSSTTISNPLGLFSFIRRCSALKELSLGPGLILENFLQVDSFQADSSWTTPPCLEILTATCNATTHHLLSLILQADNAPFRLDRLVKLDISLYDSNVERLNDLHAVRSADLLNDIAKLSQSSLLYFDVKLLQSVDLATHAPPPFHLSLAHPRILGLDICDVPGHFEPLAFLGWWMEVLRDMSAPHDLEYLIIRVCVDVIRPELLTICSSVGKAAWQGLDALLTSSRFKKLRQVMIFMNAVKPSSQMPVAKMMSTIQHDITESMSSLNQCGRLRVELLI